MRLLFFILFLITETTASTIPSSARTARPPSDTLLTQELVVHDPTIDPIFKITFGEDSARTIDFLNAVYGHTGDDLIRTIEFLKDEDPASDEFGRAVIFDIKCRDGRGNEYIVEMQKAKHHGLEKRLVYYAARQITKQYLAFSKPRAKRSPTSIQQYSKLMPVHVLAITDFIMFPDEDAPVVSSWDIRWRHDPSKIASNIMSWTFIQLPSFDKEIPALRGSLDYWLYFLRRQDCERVRLTSQLTGNNPAIISAYQRVANLTPAEVSALETVADVQQVWRGALDFAKDEGVKEGMAKGMVEGGRARAIEIARQMLTRKIDIQTIAEVTELSIKEIRRLQSTDDS